MDRRLVAYLVVLVVAAAALVWGIANSGCCPPHRLPSRRPPGGPHGPRRGPSPRR